MAKSLEEIDGKFKIHFSKERVKSLPETKIPVRQEGELSVQIESKSGKAAVISDVLFYFALVAMVVCAVLFSRGAFGQQTFGGYRFYEVLTASMESIYPRGSLVLIKETDTDELVVGDDITFARDSNNVITHRIVEIIEDYDGRDDRGFVTRGVENSTPDSDVVAAENVIGKVVKGIPEIGRILRILGENLWIILVFFILLIACSFFLKTFFREGKKQKRDKKQTSYPFGLDHNGEEEMPLNRERTGGEKN